MATRRTENFHMAVVALLLAQGYEGFAYTVTPRVALTEDDITFTPEHASELIDLTIAKGDNSVEYFSVDCADAHAGHIVTVYIAEEGAPLRTICYYG